MTIYHIYTYIYIYLWICLLAVGFASFSLAVKLNKTRGLRMAMITCNRRHVGKFSSPACIALSAVIVGDLPIADAALSSWNLPCSKFPPWA